MKQRIFTFIVSYILIQQVASKVNFKLHHFDLCNKTQGYFKFVGNITIINNVLCITVVWDIKLPLNERIGAWALVETKVTKTLYVEVFTIREKNACKAANTYLGESWFSIESEVGIQQGVCPIPARKYVVKGLEVDLKKLKIQTFPYGTLRITINLVDNLDKSKLITCFLVEVENVRK